MGKKNFQKTKNNNKNKNQNNNNKDENNQKKVQPFNWTYENSPLPDTFTDDRLEIESQKILEYLKPHIPEDFLDIVRFQLRTAIFQFSHVTQKKCAELLRWMLYHPNIEIIKENWKDKVSDSKYKGISVKISSGSKYQKKSDDLIYRQNFELQNLLPRGMVFIRHKPDLDNNVDLVLFGNRKFYGRKRGDDDDSDFCSMAFRDGKYESFLISKKANGELCQIGLLRDQTTWLIGSKNRKLIAKQKEDLSMYLKDKMYSFSAEIALCFFNYLEKLSPCKVEDLKKFLGITGLTLNFEFESTEHQHIVPLFSTRLVFIGCTGIHIPENMALHPFLNKGFADYFEFPNVFENLKIFPKEKSEEKCLEIVQEWNEEGAVLILLNQEKKIVDLVKVKTWWYILLRAMREQIRFDKDRSVLVMTRAVSNRFKVLSSELCIPKSFIETFTLLSQSFIQFLSSDPKKRQKFRELYPQLWLEFLKSFNFPNDKTILKTNLKNISQISLETSSLPLLILTQGLPGLGKSFVSEQIKKILETEYSVSCCVIAQDDFYKFSKKKAGVLCLEHTKKILQEKKHNIVILARNNANITQYKNYLELELSGLCKIIFTAPEEFQTRRLDLIYICMCSVFSRKKIENEHPTTSMEDIKLAELPLFFNKELSIHPSAFLVKMLNDKEKIEYDSKLLESLLSKKRKMDEKCLKAFRLLDEDHVTTISRKFHRNVLELACEMSKFFYQTYKFDIPSNGSYIAAVLQTEDSSRLLELCNVPQKWTKHAHHVTLIHSYDFLKNPEKWQNAYQLIGREVLFEDIKILKKENILYTAKVRILLKNQIDQINNNNNNNNNNNSNNNNSYEDGLSYVASGIPHITIATAPSIQARESIDYLKKSTESDLIPLNLQIPLIGTIQLITFDDYL